MWGSAVIRAGASVHRLGRRRLGGAAVFFAAGLIGTALLPSAAFADASSADFYFTTYQGQPNVWKAHYSYDGASTFSVSEPTSIASLGGADGIQFAPNGNLLVGGQGDSIYEVDPSNGSSTQKTPDAATYHVSVSPDGQTAYGTNYTSDASHVAAVPLNPFANGTSHTVSGDDTSVISIAFAPDGTAYYTNGNHGFGTIDLSTYKTTQKIDDATALPDTHSLRYDSFTGDFMVFGGTGIEQVDPNTDTVVSSLTINGVNMDQGTVDGHGHLLVADNGGNLIFVDYAASGKVGDKANFIYNQFLKYYLDDVAPLAGAGAPSADLQLTGSVAPKSATVGDDITYTFTATNNGPNPATGVQIHDSLPSSVSFEGSKSSSQCTGTTTVTCDLGSLASKASKSVNIVVRANQAGTVSNTASVSGDQPDPDTSNNSVTLSSTVSSPPPQPTPTKPSPVSTATAPRPAAHHARRHHRRHHTVKAVRRHRRRPQPPFTG